MPFKLRLKKSRQYNVVSKSLFVICVELLDSTTIECTLSAESIGRECLDNVCQRLGLNQQELFGLRYINRDGAPRWLEMERPLKRQLDKHSTEPGLLYLRVMYYVNGVSLLNDEMTRYHYFLQLKNDVIEGRISCDAKQAVLLASYSMQAEFGNHDLERHTAEYLRDFALFPKHLTEEGGGSGRLESLTEAAILQHAALAGLAQGTAEEYYILASQQLDGYGQETFLAKDESGSEVVLGVSLTGIVVASETNRTSKFYRWKDIMNVINHKRHFGMVCQNPEDSAHFTLLDVESAKYVWRMCVHQHTFFMQNEQACETSSTAQIVRNLFSQTSTNEEGQQLGNSREELDGREVSGGGGAAREGSGGSWEVQRAQSASCLDLATPQDLDKLRALLPSYRPAPDYETAMQQQQKEYHDDEHDHNDHNHHHDHDQAGQLHATGGRMRGAAVLYSSQPEIHQSHLLQEGAMGGGAYAYKHYPVEMADMARVYVEQQQHPGSDDGRRRVSNECVPNLHTYSTPELDANHQLMQHSFQLLHLYKPPPPYPMDPIMGGRPSSNSTPDLATGGHQVQTLAQTLGGGRGGRQPVHDFIGGQVSGSSPDLVSSRSLAAAAQANHHGLGLGSLHLFHHHQPPSSSAYHTHQHPLYPPHHILPNPDAHHRTYTDLANLTLVDSSQRVGLQQQQQQQQQQRLDEQLRTFDDRNIMYLVGHGARLPTGHNQQQFASSPAPPQPASSQGSGEPIYENVPLPWAGPDPTEPGGRSRASSVQSAPEMTTQLRSTATTPGSSSSAATASSAGTQITAVASNKTAALPSNHHHHHRQHSTTAATNDRNLLSQQLQQQVAPASLNETTAVASDPAVPGSNSTSTGSLGKQGKGRRKWGGLLGGGGSKAAVQKAGDVSRLTHAQQKGDDQQQGGGPPWLPLPPTVSKETMCRLLEKKLSDSQLFFEFEKIPKQKSNADFTTALHPDNASRNRFSDVLPYEENRVRLTPCKENKTGYVNASHITASVGTHQRFYIAGQSPLPNTVASFWQMVWEADIYLVVSLGHTDTEYCPTATDRCLEITEFEVWGQFSQETGHCVTTKLRVYHAPSRRSRGVWHLQYSEWADHGCPNTVSHFLGFLEELSSVRQHTVGEIPAGHNRNPPVLVHCSSGVGLSAVLLLSDLLLYTLDHNQELDIPRIVALLRQQRMLMVQSVAQYRFVHSLLIFYLKNSRLI